MEQVGSEGRGDCATVRLKLSFCMVLGLMALAFLQSFSHGTSPGVSVQESGLNLLACCDETGVSEGYS